MLCDLGSGHMVKKHVRLQGGNKSLSLLLFLDSIPKSRAKVASGHRKIEFGFLQAK